MLVQSFRKGYIRNKKLILCQVDEVEVYPAAGMLVTALQAAVQLAITSRVIDGFHSKDVVWKKALVMPVSDSGVEVQITLIPGRKIAGRFLAWHQFRICSYEAVSDEWSESGFV